MTLIRVPIQPALTHGLKSSLVTLALPAMALAAPIIIDPDDYAEGDDLSNVSSVVTLARLNGGLSPTESVFATAPVFGFPAPQGELTFGNYQGGPGFCTGSVECAFGLGVVFNQPVNSVSILAINSGYPPGLPAEWLAYDAQGEVLAMGGEYGDHLDNYGVPFEVTVAVPNMAAVAFGGGVTTQAMEFDRLSVHTVSVPEPTTLMLFGVGLAGLALARRKRIREQQ